MKTIVLTDEEMAMVANIVKDRHAELVKGLSPALFANGTHRESLSAEINKLSLLYHKIVEEQNAKE